jgi:diguanylate cyclase (GGDEF)-like protein
MKLRLKLFTPLLLFSLLFGIYFRFLWFPGVVDTILQQSEKNWNAHILSISEGLTPLLLENRLANIYESLEALLKENENWLSIELVNSAGRRLFPLGRLPDPVLLPLHTQVRVQSVGFVEPHLAQLKVTRDVTPLLAEIEDLELHLSLVLLFLLITFVLFTGGLMELHVRRRLNKLSLAAKRLSAGDYEADLPKKSSDEIGELTNVFQNMRQDLAAYHQQLQGEVDNHRRTAEALEEEKERASYHATHDSLTGLINRREFERLLTETLHETNLDDSHHVLLYLDLDQFKIVNDTCGHIAGDALLQQLHLGIQNRIRQNDSLARLGGDEFGVLLKHCSIDNAMKVADKMRQAVQDFRFAWENKSFAVGVSIGAVGIDRNSSGISNLLSMADAACYMAKERGRNRVQLYQQTDEDLARQHGDMLWVSRLTDALNNDKFQLYCQPIVPLSNTASGSSHYEILLRLQDQNGNLAPPGAFIPAAERFDMIALLDRWVVDHVFDYLRQCKHSQTLRLSINLSGKSLSDKSFLDHIEHRIRNGDVEGYKICFEITESAAVTSLSTALHFINTLKVLGCRFSLDDFGRGMSSFTYLKTLPVDYLKIDGSFIKDIVIDPVVSTMVKAINEIAHTMNLQTVAEYVETEPILKELQQMNIDYAQGYHICKPFPIVELTDSDEWLMRHTDTTDTQKNKASKIERELTLPPL